MAGFRNILIAFVGLLFSSIVRGQEARRFLYFQSDPVQSFEVFYAGISQKASASGYLILSGLPAQEIEFVLSLSGQMRYRIDLTSGDRGLSVRMQDSSWRLWDLSRNNWVDPQVDLGQGSEFLDSTGASPFARLLSKAAQDPSLLSNKRKGLSKLPMVTYPFLADTLALVQVKAPSLDKAIVDRKFDSLVWQSDYYVPEGKGVDTVRIEIWSDPPVATEAGGDSTSCVALLGEPEFLQLRARMAAAADEDEMVSLARRIVRTHCMNTSQVRRLSNLFLSDVTRFRFYDMLQGHVSDPESFPALASFLTDPVYQKRFRALTER